MGFTGCFYNEVVTINYNSMGLPSSLSSSSASGTLVDSASYDEASRLTKLRFPAGGNLWRTQTYWPWPGSNNNSNGRLNTIKVGTSDGSDERLSLTYGYNSFGNIGGLTEQYGSARADKLFCYDNQNRLLRGYDAYNVTAPYVQNCATGNSSGRTYSYDSAGRLTAYENAALTMNTTFPVHTVKNSGYTYDANGNLKTRGGYTLEWDEENHLSAVKNGSTSIESYLYDADGMRVKKSGGNAATYYINAFYEVTIDIPPTPTPTPPPTATPTRTSTPTPTRTPKGPTATPCPVPCICNNTCLIAP